MSLISLSDKEALDRIHRLLDGQLWSADTIEDIATVVALTGREIREPDELDDDSDPDDTLSESSDI